MTDERPRPKYGEYAPLPPAGVTPPVVSPEPQAAASFPPPTAPVVQPERKRRVWDVVLTATLLIIGTFDVVTGLGNYADFGGVIATVFDAQGIGEFTAYETAATVGAAANGIRITLLVLATVIALMMIARYRIAFWVPLAAGVLAGIAVIVCSIIVIAADPAFTAYVQSGVAP